MKLETEIKLSIANTDVDDVVARIEKLFTYKKRWGSAMQLISFFTKTGLNRMHFPEFATDKTVASR